jgi:hypothetical protein
MAVPGSVWRRREPEATVLYRVVQAEWCTFEQRLESGERVVPQFCRREVEGYLRCGILGHGFARVFCEACAKDDVVAFSSSVTIAWHREPIVDLRASVADDHTLDELLAQCDLPARVHRVEARLETCTYGSEILVEIDECSAVALLVLEVVDAALRIGHLRLQLVAALDQFLEVDRTFLVGHDDSLALPGQVGQLPLEVPSALFDGHRALIRLAPVVLLSPGLQKQVGIRQQANEVGPDEFVELRREHRRLRASRSRRTEPMRVGTSTPVVEVPAAGAAVVSRHLSAARPADHEAAQEMRLWIRERARPKALRRSSLFSHAASTGQKP